MRKPKFNPKKDISIKQIITYKGKQYAKAFWFTERQCERELYRGNPMESLVAKVWRDMLRGGLFLLAGLIGNEEYKGMVDIANENK